MKKIFEEFSFGLFISQTFVLLLLILVIYYLIKVYKKLTKYLDKNSK